MLVTSRSFAEYEAMFDLDEPALAGPVLDCCAGTSSFVAELVERGGHGTAVDPVYAWPRTDLAAMVAGSLADANQIVDTYSEQYTWDWYGTPQRRGELRQAAAVRFLDDVTRHPANYRAAALPDLPFADDSYDLVVCSHLLFTWANQFDADWHFAALTELVRVARREVRVYPLVLQGAGEPVPFLDELLTRLREPGHDVSTRPVPFAFQRSADSMLVIRPAGGAG